MSDYQKTLITDCLRAHIIAEDALRKNDCSWMSVRPRRDSEEGKEYYLLSEAHGAASAALWMATDVEYGEDGFREHVWNWRYWKVMARKCCWYQRFGTTRKAGATMAKLQKAEDALVAACGLTDIYRDPCSYIEERFPKLKFK